MRNRVFSRFLTVFLLGIVVFGGSGSAVAQTEGTPTPTATSTPDPFASPVTDPNLLSFAFYPSDGHNGDYFDPTIKAGETAKLKVIIGNSGNVVFEARTYKINAGTAPNGGFLADQAGAELTGVTNWLDYPEETFIIQVDKGIERSFSITVPEGTAPGQYLTAIAVETAEAREVEGTDTLKQIIRQVVPVFITVPGEIVPEFTIGGITMEMFENGGALTIEIVNPGNVRVQPEGTVTIFDSAGATILTAPIAMDSVYARDATTLSIGFPSVPPGDYSASVDLKDPDTGATASVSNMALIVQVPATPPPPVAIGFSSAVATPLPSLEEIQFLDIAVTLFNNDVPLTNMQLKLTVSKDGEIVEEYPFAASLAIPAGETVVQSRYLPITGWESGTWTFVLTLETIDQGSQVIVVVASTDLGGPIEVP